MVTKKHSTKIALGTGGALSTTYPSGNNVRTLGVVLSLDDFLNTPLGVEAVAGPFPRSLDISHGVGVGTVRNFQTPHLGHKRYQNAMGPVQLRTANSAAGTCPWDRKTASIARSWNMEWERRL